ncbi:EamA family transporter [Peredibacter starrii]|uniref:EamA family transporter n=1 Tax=Peredibacter starrii TaxID=28202 RepID=A0AAX4HUH6_9BACT|nr:EamA family transporter [Peredibacter starrii]WPU66848.1 EamA family transporter [Peredibacter starrii]
MNIRIILSFAVIYIIWGSTFTAIKWGLDAFPPFLLSGMRFSLAGMVFFLIAKGRGIREMTGKEIRREMLVGFFLTLGNAGVCWAEQYISSGIAALIVGAIPVMFILFNWLGFEKKAPTISALIAFAIGLTGITLISLGDAEASNWKVIVALMLANCSWVTGSLIFRTSTSKAPYFPRASIQTLSGGMFIIFLSNVVGERSVNWGSLPISGILSVAYLALAGTILAYTCYSYLLRNVRTELTSTYALVNPMLAILFGVVWLKEPFTLKVAIAGGLILMSVVMVIYGDKLFPKPVPVNKKQ